MDNDKFIYVFSEDAKTQMIKAGYALIMEDTVCGRYVFENNPNLNFSLLDISAIKSNTLTF